MRCRHAPCATARVKSISGVGKSGEEVAQKNSSDLPVGLATWTTAQGGAGGALPAPDMGVSKSTTPWEQAYVGYKKRWVSDPYKAYSAALYALPEDSRQTESTDPSPGKGPPRQQGPWRICAPSRWTTRASLERHPPAGVQALGAEIPRHGAIHHRSVPVL